MYRTSHAFLLLFAAFVIVAVGACSSLGSKPEPEIQTLGFLDDYSQLEPGRAGQASLIHISDEADFSGYSAILVEPVVAWGRAGVEPTDATRELAKSLDASLRREFALAFELVDRPRAGALEMRSALASDPDSHLVLEVEILDGATGERVIAASDRRPIQSNSEDVGSANPLEEWPVLIRNRLATLRQFDAAARVREEGEDR